MEQLVQLKMGSFILEIYLRLGRIKVSTEVNCNRKYKLEN